VLALYFTLPVFREHRLIQPFWQFATFTENLFIDTSRPKAFSHVWSLCIEEQFYLVAPLAVWLLMRRPTAGRALAACLAVFLGGVAWREWVWWHDLAPLQYMAGGVQHFWVIWQEKIYYATAARLDDLLGGVMLAMVNAFCPSLWAGLMRRANGLLVLGLAAITAAAWMSLRPTGPVTVAVEFPILALGATCLVAAGASPRSLIGRWPVPGAGPIAAMAYSLYLTHKEVLHMAQLAAEHGLDNRPILACLVYGGAVFAAGASLYWSVERPALRLRDKALKAAWLAASPSQFH
jgi:peptidoglycan/LPS O-acetylase OafA/YrhL